MGKLPTIKQGSDTMQCSVLDSPRRAWRPRREFGQNHRPADVSKPPSESIVSRDVLQSQGKHHDGSASPAGASFQLTEQRRLHFLGIDCHLAGSDLLFAGAVITEFADTQTSLGLHRRTEDAAGHWSHRVEIA